MMMIGSRKKYVGQILGDDPRGVSKETPLQTIASELIDSIHSHDTEAVISCLRAMLTHLGAEANVEAENVNE